MAATLPEEVISYILKFLSLSDQKMAAMVCKSWYQASIHPKLTSSRLLRFHNWSELEEATSTWSLNYSASVILESIDNSSTTRSRIAAISSHAFDGIRSLSLAGCDITEAIFTTIVSGCTNLEVLDISSCNMLFMTGQLLAKPDDFEKVKSALVKVNDLRLGSLRYLSDVTFNRLVSVCPGITRLSLAGNQIVFHSVDYFRTVEVSSGANSAVMTFNNLLTYICSVAGQLTSLDLKQTGITHEALKALAQTADLHLTEMNLSHCQNLCDAGVQALISLQPSICVLDISECLSLTDVALESICAGLGNLLELNVAKCRQITDHSISKLRSLRCLKRLNLNACYTVTSRGMSLGLCNDSDPMRYLTSLSLASCSSVRDGFVVEMAVRLPFIEKLDLSSCNVGNTGLHSICALMTRLRELRIAWCQDVTDNGLLGIRDQQSSESHYHDDDEGLCRCTRRQNSVPVFNPPKSSTVVAPTRQQRCYVELNDLRPITNLKNLRVLDLTSCHRLTDAGLVKIMSFPELRSLQLSLCPALTDATLLAIANGVPSLEELHLAQCVRITDAGVSRLSESLRRLSYLDVSSCDRLTNRTLEALFHNTKGLRHLDVSLCREITTAALDMFEHNLGHLVSVQKRLVGIKA